MPFIEFDESFMLGIPKIDEQHKKWVQLTNILYKEIQNNTIDDNLINTMIDELFEYSKNHFSLEENYFEKCKYKNISEHIAEHKKFIEKSENLRSKYKAGNKDVAVDLLGFMAQWVVFHIKNSDMKYKDLLSVNELT